MSYSERVRQISIEVGLGKRPPMTRAEILAEASHQGAVREPYRDAPERPEPEPDEPPPAKGELSPGPSGDAFAGGEWYD
jgi:hypothetical protein